MKNADQNWFEQWIKDNDLVDKDKKSSHSEANDIAHKPFKNSSLIASKPPTLKSPEKFFIEEENSLDQWLQKNEVFDKDQRIKDKEVWKYPPENLHAVRIDCTIDLHKLTVSQAILTVKQFIFHCHKRNDRVVRLIHGKGKHSKGIPKVKIAVLKWIKTEGKGFIHLHKEAPPRHGGSGATLVWLK